MEHDDDDDDDEWTCLPSKPPTKVVLRENGKANPSNVTDNAGEDDDEDWTCLPSKPPKLVSKENGRNQNVGNSQKQRHANDDDAQSSGSRSFSSVAATPVVGAAAAAAAAATQERETVFLLEHWRAEVQDNRLQADPQQERAAKRLQKLQLALHGYDNTPWIEHYEKRAEIRRKREQLQEEAQKKEKQAAAQADEDSRDKISHLQHQHEDASPLPPEPEPPQIRIPRGLYLYGSVGTGKSLLMDRFFDLVPVPVEKKRRCHFHAFMAEVHERIHRLKLNDLETYGRNFHVDTNEYRNPIHRVGRQISGETALLCFE